MSAYQAQLRGSIKQLLAFGNIKGAEPVKVERVAGLIGLCQDQRDGSWLVREVLWASPVKGPRRWIPAISERRYGRNRAAAVAQLQR